MWVSIETHNTPGWPQAHIYFKNRELGMVMHAYYTSILEAEAKDCEFEVSGCYMARPYLSKQTNKQTTSHSLGGKKEERRRAKNRCQGLSETF
jgi:hypothetical protein